MKKGIVLIPTLNRPALLLRFMSSAVLTKTMCDMWFLIDDEDYSKNEADYQDIESKCPANWMIKKTGKSVSMGDKVRFVWPLILLNGYEWVGLLNDDHVCVTDEWDQKSEKRLDGTNFVSTNDGSWNFGSRVVGLTAWSMPLLEACGFPIFPRNLQHWFIDDVWKSIGESTGCWHETMMIDIHHRHVFKGEMEQDETFKVTNNQEQIEYSMREFKHFMEQDFKDVCAKIIKFREKQIQERNFL